MHSFRCFTFSDKCTLRPSAMWLTAVLMHETNQIENRSCSIWNQAATFGSRSNKIRTVPHIETHSGSQQFHCESSGRLAASGWIRVANVRQSQDQVSLVHHLVQEINIGDHAKGMAVASLPRLLQEKCNHSQFFRDMLQDIVRTHGPELSLVLAWDEEVPGNILQPDLRRKCALTYASLAQMIPWLEESWVTVAIARTTMLSDIIYIYIWDIPNL